MFKQLIFRITQVVTLCLVMSSTVWATGLNNLTSTNTHIEFVAEADDVSS